MSYPAGRSRVAAILLSTSWLAGAAGVFAWWVQVQASPVNQALALGAVLFGGAIALRAWARSPEGMLAWSGEEWSWTRQPHTEEGDLAAVLDLQHVMLLRWESPATPGRSRWLWVERRSEPLRWDALRRAVYSRARSEGPRGARPGGEGRT